MWNYATYKELDRWSTSRKAFSNYNFPELIYQRRCTGLPWSQSILKMYLSFACPNWSFPSFSWLHQIPKNLRITSEHRSRQHLGEPECTIQYFNKTEVHAYLMKGSRIAFPVKLQTCKTQHLHFLWISSSLCGSNRDVPLRLDTCLNFFSRSLQGLHTYN